MQVNELNYKEIVSKQKSITKLFPLYPNRVETLRGRGGIKLVETNLKYWKFRVVSGIEAGLWYDCYVSFRNLKGLIVEKVNEKGFRTPKKGFVSLLKLAMYILENADLELSCNDPSDLYWGFHYMRSQDKAKYGEQESRPPNIRNPKRKGFLCKHLGLVVNQLPMYGLTMVSYLKKYFKEYVEWKDSE